MNNKTIKYLLLNLIFFFLSALIAGYLVIHHYSIINGEAGFHSFCSISAAVDCDVVNGSRYAVIFGIPIAVIALAYYLKAMLVTAFALRSVYAQRTSCFLLLVLSTLSMIVTLVMFAIATFSIKAICIFCAGLYVLNAATFIIALLTWKSLGLLGSFMEEYQKINKKSLLGYLAFGAILLGALHLGTSQLEKTMPIDEEAVLNDYRSQTTLTLDAGNSPQMGFQGSYPPVQIIEFADFQCPACGLAAKWMSRLVKVYGDRIQLVFKNFPLDQACNPRINTRMHDKACLAAKAGLCAHQQQKFEPLYEKFYENQKDLSPENIHLWAAEIGIDTKKLDTCIDSPETAGALMADIDLATKSGIESTPTFFISGKKVEGPINEQRLRVILKELGKL